MKSKLSLIVLLMSLFFTHVNADTADVYIQPDSLRQTITGMGGNNMSFWYSSFGAPDDAVFRFNVDNLKPTIIRWAMPLQWWEPANDNTDPDSFNWTYYAAQDAGHIHEGFVKLQELKNKGIRLVCSTWESQGSWPAWGPDWVEKVECLAAYLIYVRDHYGVTFEYISFNEPDISPGLSQYSDFIKYAAPILQQHGLSPQWMFGDVASPGGLLGTSVNTMLADAALMQHCGIICYHNWTQSGVSDAQLIQIAEIGKQNQREIWVTEANQSCWTGECMSTSPTWSYAFENARNQYRSLRYAGASVLLYWQFLDNWALANSATVPPTPYPVWYVWKQLMDNLPAGTRMVKATSSNANLLPLAARNDSLNHFMTQAINAGNSVMTVRFHGLPQGALSLCRTSSTQNMAAIGSYQVANDSVLTLAFPAQSVNTLSGGQNWPLVVSLPVMSPSGGVVTGSSQTVTITCATAGATIYYTTNGSDPTTASQVYGSPLTISTITTVKAMATKSGLANSAVATATYVFLAGDQPRMAINCGGSAYADGGGILYHKDTLYQGGAGYINSNPISGTTDDALYQSERFGTFAYNIPLANGNYEVTLKFAELYWSAAGARLFNVNAEGQAKVSNLDIYASAGGGNQAYDTTFTAAVSDGLLNLDFVTVTDNAKVDAILVDTADGSTGLSVKGLGAGFLFSAEPNPFSLATTIAYDAGSGTNCTVMIFDTRGRVVYEAQVSGKGSFTWNAKGNPSGVYLCRLTAGKAMVSKRMILMK